MELISLESLSGKAEKSLLAQKKNFKLIKFITEGEKKSALKLINDRKLPYKAEDKFITKLFH